MPHTAFGVEPNRRATYELRQSRYQNLGKVVADAADAIWQESGNRVRLLDVGTFDGVSRRYIEAYPIGDKIDFEAVDLYPYGKEYVYKHDQWTHHEIDLLNGMPQLESNSYDIVICEQVLEHLTDVVPTIQDLVRVVKPGGTLMVGVPIFPDGAHWIRKYAVPVLDRLFKTKKVRGHVQAWSKRTFIKQWSDFNSIDIQETRGFRIVSGGILRPLEFTKTWWKINRAIGAAMPGLCTEIQFVGRKTEAA
ncbi:MAG: methyltransferase domain-containing protein [Planctomycetota bacterium]